MKTEGGIVPVPNFNLRIPGPTPCPDEVLEAASWPMINHRGPEFKDLIFRITDHLKQVFFTRNDLYILTSSGTGCLEAAIVNTLSPGDKVLAVSVGVFGDRFITIAGNFGADLTKLQVEHGNAVDPEDVRKALNKDPGIKAVILTHNETSTGVTNDLQAIAQIVKGEFDKLLLVDAVSSLGCIPCPVDEWQCDVVGTASQKGLMVPPGLAFVSISPDGWKAYEEATMPRFYFDFGLARRYYERGQTPTTPCLPLLYGLDVALDMMLEQGMDSVFERHARLGRMTREAIKGMGLSLLADGPHASNTVTAVWLPEGVDGGVLLDYMRANRNVVMAGGQGRLEGKIFRIGHMGYVNEDDLTEALGALEEALPVAGYRTVHAAGGPA